MESRCEDTLMLTMLYTLLFKGNCFVLCLACDCAFCLKDGGRCIGLYDRRWDIRSTALLVFTNCHRGNGFYDFEAWSLPSKAMDEAISVSVMKVELLHCVVAFTDLIYSTFTMQSHRYNRQNQHRQVKESMAHCAWISWLRLRAALVRWHCARVQFRTRRHCRIE